MEFWRRLFFSFVWWLFSRIVGRNLFMVLILLIYHLNFLHSSNQFQMLVPRVWPREKKTRWSHHNYFSSLTDLILSMHNTNYLADEHEPKHLIKYQWNPPAWISMVFFNEMHTYNHMTSLYWFYWVLSDFRCFFFDFSFEEISLTWKFFFFGTNQFSKSA